MIFIMMYFNVIADVQKTVRPNTGIDRRERVESGGFGGKVWKPW